LYRWRGKTGEGEEEDEEEVKKRRGRTAASGYHQRKRTMQTP
jgi:hypothetical protein